MKPPFRRGARASISRSLPPVQTSRSERSWRRADCQTPQSSSGVLLAICAGLVLGARSLAKPTFIPLAPAASIHSIVLFALAATTVHALLVGSLPILYYLGTDSDDYLVHALNLVDHFHYPRSRPRCLQRNGPNPRLCRAPGWNIPGVRQASVDSHPRAIDIVHGGPSPASRWPCAGGFRQHCWEHCSRSPQSCRRISRCRAASRATDRPQRSHCSRWPPSSKQDAGAIDRNAA